MRKQFSIEIHSVSGATPSYPDSKVHGANMGPTWVLLASDEPHTGPMNFAIWVRTHGVVAWDIVEPCIIISTHLSQEKS